jgi:hypothetical protein
MKTSPPWRPHLVERAAEAARAAMASDMPLARVSRPLLAPVEAIPAAVETVVEPAPRSQTAGPPGHGDPPPVTRTLLRRAGLVSEAAPRGRRSR